MLHWDGTDIKKTFKYGMANIGELTTAKLLVTVGPGQTARARSQTLDDNLI